MKIEHTLPGPRGTDPNDLEQRGDEHIILAEIGNRPVINQVAPTEYSEDALSLQFVDYYGADYRWSPGKGWMHYDGETWLKDDRLTRYDHAKRVVRVNAEASPDKIKRTLCSSRTTNAVIEMAKSDPRIVLPDEAWDKDIYALNTPDGVVNLRTGMVRERGREDYLTHSASVSPTKGGLVVWRKFLRDVFHGDDEVIRFVQKALGYCLTGDVSEQVMFFCHGSGRNGKSTLLDLVMRIMGDYALKLPATVLMKTGTERHPTELAQLQGKRLAVSSELEEGQRWAEARIKELTGDEVLTARYMRQDYFEFKQTQKHFVAGNSKPRLRGGDDAMARRMVLVPFLAEFDASQRDERMPKKLWDEAPAILGWLVEGAAIWYRERIGIPESIKAASREYMESMDDIGLWVGECCEKGDAENAAPLYESYRQWKESCGENAPSMKVWGQAMSDRYDRRRLNTGIRYLGIALTKDERIEAKARIKAKKKPKNY